jgi:multiple sugar transport system substrate-binding protein
MKLQRLALAALLLFSTGCSGLLFHPGSPSPVRTASPTGPATQTVTANSTEIPTPAASPTADQPKGPLTLTIWVPPQFDPEAGTAGSDLLKKRLEEFKARRPGISLDVRVKALDGPGGLLDTLSSASAAATRVLPDLVALPRPMMEAAALKGLLHPYDGLSTAL